MTAVVLDGYTLNPGDLSWDGLHQIAEAVIHDRTPAEAIVERSQGARILFTNKTPLSAETLSRLPDTRYIGVLATGYNIVDAAAARKQGIVVTNIPTYGTASVAQFAFALLLELCHHAGRHSREVRAGAWGQSADWSFSLTPQVELAGLTMGIVGFGRIGRQVGKIADAIGMKVIANDTNQSNPPDYEGFRWAGLDELLGEADVVSLHSPLFPDTLGMINSQRLRAMKKSAFLINTSRGPLVKEQELAEALAAGEIAGAGLDVLTIEPPVEGSPLFSAPNCVITPHIAWSTKAARARLLDLALDNLRAFLAGSPKNTV
ncbi:MAG: D-2-hydroxyacid dehydrogenase [Acidobacteria bacterium]|nr:D-2-hydroxyacid dehydrogenase [Acidobacteriota bacterium]